VPPISKGDVADRPQTLPTRHVELAAVCERKTCAVLGQLSPDLQGEIALIQRNDGNPIRVKELSTVCSRYQISICTIENIDCGYSRQVFFGTYQHLTTWKVGATGSLAQNPGTENMVHAATRICGGKQRQRCPEPKRVTVPRRTIALRIMAVIYVLK